MSKIFDYKFLIILGLSLVVYFLYREVEFLNKRVAKLECNVPAIDRPKPQMIELPPPPNDDENISSTVEEITNQTTNENLNDSLKNFEKNSSISTSESSSTVSSPKRSSPKRSSPKRSSPKWSSPKGSSPKSPTGKTTIDNIIDRTIAETLNQTNNSKFNNAILQTTVNNDEIEELHGTVEEYSNEHTNVEHIYSHDGLDSNTLDNDSMMVDSIVNMVKDNDICEIQKPKHTIESLTRLKLDELQEMATSLNININTENGKKKKKADLAQEILAQENLNKTL